jgi:aminopeptidase N
MTRYFFLLLIVTVALAGSLQGQNRSPQRGIDVLHYDFSLTIPDSGRNIEGLALITVRRSLPARHFILDLVDLHVDTVWVNQRPVGFARKPDLLDIPLTPSHDSSPDTLLIAVRYQGEVKDGLIIHADEKGRWYAFGDNWPTRARCWLPTVDQPGDKATVTWNITAPSNRKVVANGTLVEEKSLPLKSGASSRTLTRWTTTRPIPPYLMVIAVGPLVKYDLGLTASGLSEFPNGVQQSVYAVAELADYLPGPFKSAGAIMELYSRTVAPFPYEKLAHVQSFTRYGGMENASAIFYANNLFQRRDVSTGIIAHETAHQWFGDAVTPQSWGHLWLSEGFASYFEQLWVESSTDIPAFRTGMGRLRNEILRSSVTFSRPVVDTLETVPMKLLNSNSYQKGAWVLHMLRSMIGDSLFFQGVRSYYRSHRHATATTDDLCDELGKVSKRDLRWFFEQWLRRPGVPELAMSSKMDHHKQEIVFEVSQGQRSNPYRFPLRIELLDAAGKSQLMTLQVPAERTVTLVVPFPAGFRPTTVSYDPNTELLASIRSR